MKNFIFMILISFLFLSPVFRAQAQTGTDTENETQSLEFDMTGFPQWAKDLRRWDIVAFGVFPLALFFTTMANDLVRWNNANGMNMSDRYYAPWPLKSAGGYEMTKDDYKKVLLQTAGVSALLACTDLIIVLIKRYKERKRIESKPKSSAVIEIKPYGDPAEEAPPEDAGSDKPPEADDSGKK